MWVAVALVVESSMGRVVRNAVSKESSEVQLELEYHFAVVNKNASFVDSIFEL